MKHVFCGIYKWGEKDKENPFFFKWVVQSWIKSLEGFGHLSVAIADYPEDVCYLRKIFGYKAFFTKGGTRTFARNAALKVIECICDRDTLIHWVDLDQVPMPGVHVMPMLATAYEKFRIREGYPVVMSTVRTNLDRGVFVPDDRLCKHDSYKYMYSNCLSVPYHFACQVQWDESFTTWGHEDIMYVLDIEEKYPDVSFKINKTPLLLHFEHTSSTDPGIENLEKIIKKHPRYEPYLRYKIEKHKRLIRAGFGED